MAEPAQLTPVRPYDIALIFSVEHVTCNHTELLQKLRDVRIILILAIAVLVIDLVIWLLWHADVAAVVGIMKVFIKTSVHFTFPSNI